MTEGSDRFEGIVVRAMPGQLDPRSVQKIGELRALGVHVGVVGIVSEELVDQLAADERSSAVVVFSDEEGVEIVVVDESGSVERTGLSLDGHHRLRLAVDDRERRDTSDPRCLLAAGNRGRRNAGRQSYGAPRRIRSANSSPARRRAASEHIRGALGLDARRLPRGAGWFGSGGLCAQRRRHREQRRAAR